MGSILAILAARGWKTYIAAAGLALMAILEGPLGIDVPGVDVSKDWLELLFQALGFVGIRAAIAKNIIGSIFKRPM